MGALWMSWSSYKQYKINCPKQYFLQRVKKQDPPKKMSSHNTIVGSVVQKVFEDFYNDELWRRGPETTKLLMERTDLYYWNYLKNNHIDWDDFTCRFKSKTEPLKECLEIIPKVLEGIKREKLLGPYAKSRSEDKIKVRFNKNDFLFGYLDFIIKNPDGEVLLLDGKASRHREKYVKEDQIYFYALIFLLRYKVLPDKIGYFYYRFADDPEKAIDWLPVDKKRIRDLKLDIEDTIYNIKNRRFNANPHYSYCQYCVYEQICSERQAQKKQNRVKRNKNSKKKSVDADFKGGKAKIGFDSLK